MSKNFIVSVELAKNTDVVVTERPFIRPSTTSISTSHQKPTGQKGKKATQPVEAPGAVSGSQLVTSDEVSATQSVEASGADTENLPADQHASLSAATYVRTGGHSSPGPHSG